MITDLLHLAREGGFLFDPTNSQITPVDAGGRPFIPGTAHVIGRDGMSPEAYERGFRQATWAWREHFGHGRKILAWRASDREVFLVAATDGGQA